MQPTETQYFRPASPQDARAAIVRIASERTCIVYIRELKTRPEKRRMVCRYFGGLTKSLATLRVWDLDRGAPRTITLDRVEEIAWNEPVTSEPVPERAPDRQPAQAAGRAAMKAQLHTEFY